MSVAESGHEFIDVEVIVNGRTVRSRVRARQHLADFLRQELELTGTHLGCEHGVCGACTVLIDGRTARGCLTLAAQAHGKRIETVEGLSGQGAFARLQDAFIGLNAAQCGFCTSGMLLTAYELVSEKVPRTRNEIRDYLSGNMCRCTGYHAIIDAVASVLAEVAPA
ncbi:MAG TPA: (2Fe-2S)-binding protein [Pseudolabrys sp.]|uniref:(2Fe-2S)-binding protein n=1 Tax=Pseudolabrys sp. TaxID=1960880 RepID=UPI002DDCB595|nr:(2Fe-2S)-binding protein [Pseudolabrys sp.]HEV2629207.1 (2Fe-2S)-binding protein [Pseudolabrys sp.]